MIGLSQFLVVVILIAKQLRIEELASNLNQLEPSFRLTQKDKQMLKERLLRQEAWYARNEVVSFVKERRYEKTPMNFAKALAGLPECGWLRSHRRCSEIQDESLVPTTFNYQLFEILRMTVKKMKRIDLRKIETMLQDKLLKQGPNSRLLGYVGPNWAYMRQAFAECRGKRLKRSELTNRIMARFLANFERPKTITELELAKREQLV